MQDPDCGYRTLKSSASEIDASDHGGQDRAGTGSDLLSDYANTAELAQSFGVSTRTIDRWIRLRIIPPPVRLGRTALHHIPTIKKHLLEQVDLHGRHPSRRRLKGRERSA